MQDGSASGPDPLPPAGDRWHDLSTRLVSAGVLLAVGAVGVIQGGLWFSVIVTFVAAMIVWEVGRIIRPGSETHSATLAVLTACVMAAMPHGLDAEWEMLFLALPAAIGLFLFGRQGPVFAVFALAAALAGWALVAFRDEPGLAFVLWLVVVVVVTDVLGYFAGRHFGGPKFWPRVSPKKTWAGTAAGWLGAAVVGLVFLWPLEQGVELVPISVLVSFASQLGDIAESALKRRFGVKDSSDLIPGHGGIYDRFDALMGAAFFVMLVWLLTGWPG